MQNLQEAKKLMIAINKLLSQKAKMKKKSLLSKKILMRRKWSTDASTTGVVAPKNVLLATSFMTAASAMMMQST